MAGLSPSVAPNGDTFNYMPVHPELRLGNCILVKFLGFTELQAGRGRCPAPSHRCLRAMGLRGLAVGKAHPVGEPPPLGKRAA